MLYFKKVLQYALVVTLLTTTLSCSGKEEVTIGFSTPLTGPLSNFGIELRDGANIAVQKLNDSQNRTTYVLDIMDNRGDVELAIEHMNMFKEKGIEVVTGIPTSGMAKGILPTIESLDLTLVAPTVSSPIFNGKKDALFRLSNSSDKEANYVAEYIKTEFKNLNFIALLDEMNRAYSEQWYNSFKETLNPLMSFNLEPIYIKRPAQFTEIQSIISNNVVESGSINKYTSLIIISDPSTTAMVSQAFRTLGGSGPIIAGGWANSLDLIEFGGNAVEGIVVADMYNLRGNEESNKQFIKEYRDAYLKDPSFIAMHSYETIIYIDEAYKSMEKGMSFRQAIESVTSINGVQEEIIFDETGDAFRNYYIVGVKDKTFVTLGKVEVFNE